MLRDDVHNPESAIARLQDEGRIFGVAMDAFWLHVGDPAARDEAEARLT